MALAALIFSFDWNIDVEVEQVNIIQAKAVDESKISKQIEKLKKIEAKKKRDEDLRMAKLDKEMQQARRDRKLEQERLDTLQKKREDIKQKQLMLEQDRKKEKQRLDELKQRNEQAQQKQQDLARIRADKEREAKREKELRRRQQEIDDMQKQMEEELASRVAAEEPIETVINDPNQELVANEIQKFTALLTKKIERSWIKPPGITLEQAKNLNCVVNVRLMPTGDVSYVNIVEGCGDENYRRSVEAAVKKAAPYPIPSDMNIFDKVRDINFNFSPEQESS